MNTNKNLDKKINLKDLNIKIKKEISDAKEMAYEAIKAPDFDYDFMLIVDIKNHYLKENLKNKKKGLCLNKKNINQAVEDIIFSDEICVSSVRGTLQVFRALRTLQQNIENDFFALNWFYNLIRALERGYVASHFYVIKNFIQHKKDLFKTIEKHKFDIIMSKLNANVRAMGVLQDTKYGGDYCFRCENREFKYQNF